MRAIGTILVVTLEGVYESVYELAAAANAVEADLERATGVEEEQEH